MNPASLACNSAWHPDPRGNPLFAELVTVYGLDSALTLWELAKDWHRCELATEVRGRQLRDVA